MKEKRVNKLLIILAICLTLIIFSLAYSIWVLSKETGNIKDSLSQITGKQIWADEDNIFGGATPTIAISTTPTRPVALAPHCTTPVLLFQPPALIQVDRPEIDGRNVVFGVLSVPQSSIGFYDLGPDHKKSSDDRGFFRPFLPPVGGHDTRYNLYGNYVTFNRFVNNYPNPPTDAIMLYSFGPDGLVGTLDDVGPTQIYSSTNIYSPLSNIDGDYVNIISYDRVGSQWQSFLHYCSLFNTGAGDCFSGTINTLPPISGPNFEPLNGRISGANSYWGYLYELGSDIEYIDSTNSNGVFYNNLEIEDVAYPIILSRETVFINRSSNSSNNSSNSTNSSIPINLMVTGIFGLPQIKIPTSSNVNLGSDSNGKIAHHQAISGDLFITWLRAIGGQSQVVVSSFSYNSERIIYSPPLEFPAIDDNTLVASSNGLIYTSECT